MSDSTALDEAQTTELLSQFRQGGGRVELRWADQAQRGILARVSDLLDGLMELVAPAMVADLLPLGRYVEISIEWLGYRYYTSQPVFAIRRDGGQAVLVFRRPTSLLMIERRRFFRWPVPDGQVVEVTLEPDLGSPWSGQLVNLSAEGLACRLNPGSAAGLEMGRPVVCRIALPDAPGDPLEINATACGVEEMPEGTLMRLMFPQIRSAGTMSRCQRRLAAFLAGQAAGALDRAPLNG